MYRNHEVGSLPRRIGLSIVLGICIALVGTVLEAIVEPHPVIGLQSLDDFALGAIAAFVVFSYEQRRHKALLNKLRVITAMNHHVRNALQAISYAPYTEQREQIELIRTAVNRIQWALREVLPAEDSAGDELFAEPVQREPAATAHENTIVAPTDAKKGEAPLPS
jgi:hypothetical protein